MFFKNKENNISSESARLITEQRIKSGTTFIHPTISVCDGYGDRITVAREALWMNKQYNSEYGWGREIVIDKEGFIEAYKRWIVPLIESGELK